MNPSTSSIDLEAPKPISSPRRTLPEAPPSYYDFPPSYTTNSDVYTDELPAYCPREIPSRPCPPEGPQQIFTVLPRQTYAIRLSRTHRRPPPNHHLRRQLNKLFGLAFIIMLAIVILVLAVLMTVSLV
uniref:ORF 5 n=1 Tax=Caenorhabditis tropicalis TaxID=1561998 RepID=A0A1I7V4B5_9PELO